MIQLILAVSAGGVAGTLLRFAAGNFVSANWPRHFYTATLAVNLVGCLLIGFLYGLFLIRPEVPIELRAGLMVGFFGRSDDVFVLFAGHDSSAGKRSGSLGHWLRIDQCTGRPACDLGWPVFDPNLINPIQ